MSSGSEFVLRPIGRVESPLLDRSSAPNQPDENAPAAWLAFDPNVAEGLRDLHVGDEILVFTWLDRGKRDVLQLHPRGDTTRPLTGVFSTRSPDRPNPIGLHRAAILEMNSPLRIRVDHLEALDGTPIVDVKPVLGAVGER